MIFLRIKNKRLGGIFDKIIMMKKMYDVSSRCYQAALINDTNYKS